MIFFKEVCSEATQSNNQEKCKTRFILLRVWCLRICLFQNAIWMRWKIIFHIFRPLDFIFPLLTHQKRDQFPSHRKSIKASIPASATSFNSFCSNSMNFFEVSKTLQQFHHKFLFNFFQKWQGPLFLDVLVSRDLSLLSRPVTERLASLSPPKRNYEPSIINNEKSIINQY